MRKSVFFVVWLMLLSALSISVLADISYVENFETDTVGNNPMHSEYDYYESNTEWANVTDVVAHDGTKSYLINDSLQEGGNGYVDFEFDLQFPYESYEFYFLMRNDTHNFTMIRLMDDAKTNTIVFINITNTTVYVNNSADVLPTIYSTSIVNDTWYGLHIDFNWTDDTVFVEFLNTGGTVADDSGGWFGMGDPEAVYDFSELEYVNYTVPDGDKVWLAVDGMTVVKDSSSSSPASSSSSSLLTLILVIALVLLVLVLLVNALNNPSVDSLVMVLVTVAVIIAIVGIDVVQTVMVCLLI